MTSQNLKSKPVGELMTRNILVGHLSNPISETFRLFGEMTFHHLPIVDSKQKVVGIISSHDLLKKLTNMAPFLKDLRDESLNSLLDITEVMTPDPVTIHPYATVEEALEIFSKHHIHALPVIQDDELVGILTTNDVIKALNEKTKTS